MDKEKEEIALLKKQLTETQKLLEFERLKSEALETVINNAEKNGVARRLKIPIRKKSGPRGVPSRQ